MSSCITVAALTGPEKKAPPRRKVKPVVTEAPPQKTKVEIIRGTKRSAEELDD